MNLSKCTSNTPIFPVWKPRPDPDSKPIFHFVHDLNLINNYMVPRAPVVPNPATIVMEVLVSATYFTMVDLWTAFFNIPVDPTSQYLFALTWKDQQYTWPCLPQGYTESPMPFSQILKVDLSSISKSSKSNTCPICGRSIVSFRI